jgi:hypothetical protein
LIFKTVSHIRRQSRIERAKYLSSSASKPH